MKNLVLLLLICLSLSCKKNLDKKLASNSWKIESATITPAMISGSKSSTNYLELMGPSSCEATTTLFFSEDGIFTSSANGALCDLFYVTNSKPITWTRDGNQIKISSMPDSPYALEGNKLTQSSTIVTPGGVTHTLIRVYKANK